MPPVTYIVDNQVVRLNTIVLNEVPNTITIAGRLAPESQSRFDYVEHLRPFVASIEVQVGEAPQLTTQYSSQLLYRMFKENTVNVGMSYSDWVNNCIVVLSPQQLGLPNFSEGLSVRSSISIKLTLRPSPAARNLHENWNILNYTGTSGVVTKPTPAGNNDWR